MWTDVNVWIALAMVLTGGLIGYGVGYSQAATTRFGGGYPPVKRKYRPEEPTEAEHARIRRSITAWAEWDKRKFGG